MSPTIVLRDGRPVIALGGAGGPTIISSPRRCSISC
jgi:gamma-glutamyltranspeptidase